jgi:hypothetical protein
MNTQKVREATIKAAEELRDFCRDLGLNDEMIERAVKSMNEGVTRPRRRINTKQT